MRKDVTKTATDLNYVLKYYSKPKLSKFSIRHTELWGDDYFFFDKTYSKNYDLDFEQIYKVYQMVLYLIKGVAK